MLLFGIMMLTNLVCDAWKPLRSTNITNHPKVSPLRLVLKNDDRNWRRSSRSTFFLGKQQFQDLMCSQLDGFWQYYYQWYKSSTMYDFHNFGHIWIVIKQVIRLPLRLKSTFFENVFEANRIFSHKNETKLVKITYSDSFCPIRHCHFLVSKL